MVIPVYDESDQEPGSRPWVTWLLFALNITAFLFLTLFPAEFVQLLAEHFGVVGTYIAQGTRPEGVTLLIPPQLTLVTYTFLHGSWVHLAANMLFLWVFGDNIEAALGHLRFLLFYVACGAVGGLVHVFINPSSDIPLIGASGAVSGIVAGYLLLRPAARVTFLVIGILPVTTRAYWIVALWLAWQITNLVVPMTDMNDTNVAYWSHIGGFAAGLVLTVLLKRSGVALPWWNR